MDEAVTPSGEKDANYEEMFTATELFFHSSSQQTQEGEKKKNVLIQDALHQQTLHVTHIDIQLLKHKTQTQTQTHLHVC